MRPSPTVEYRNESLPGRARYPLPSVIRPRSFRTLASVRKGYPVRVLLINSNLRSDAFSAPPVGVCFVAGATEAVGHEVKVLDLCFVRNRLGTLEREISDFMPDVVGVSVRNIDNVNMLYPVSYLPKIKKIVRRIKRLTPVPLVLGGSGASLMPAAVLDLLKADYIVVSDGEQPFVELLECLERGKSPDNIPGVGSMKGERFHLTPPKLTEFAFARPDLGRWIDVKPYQHLGSSYNIQTKRGCVHHCVYCTYGQVLEGRNIRMRSPLEVVDEIEETLFKYEPESFEFVDSVFNCPMDHCVEILEEIIRRPWKARFTATGVSPLGLDDGLLDLMWRAGFTSFWVSPESASETMIRNYGKGFSVDDIVHAATAIAKTRFTTLWCFLIGGPGETNQTLQESLDFTMKYLRRDSRPPINLASFYFGLRIYPNTRLWDIAVRDRFIRPDSDPLDQLWYLSEELDLHQALKQFKDVVFNCPEISGGYQEMFMGLSRMAACLCKLLGIRKPYWPNIIRANEIFYKMRLQWLFPLPDLAGRIRRQLAGQGYRGAHLTPLPKS